MCHTEQSSTFAFFLFQNVSVGKAINVNETPVKEKHARSILLFSMLSSNKTLYTVITTILQTIQVVKLVCNFE